MTTGIVWFRQDLRLADNPALSAACKSCDRLVLLYIDDHEHQGAERLGQASRVWLHHSLQSLSDKLESTGNSLVLARGEALAVLQVMAKRYKASRLFWNRCYDPFSKQRDTNIKSALGHLQPQSFNALQVGEPWQCLKPDGTPYKVFTPYWNRRCDELPGDKPLPTPKMRNKSVPVGNNKASLNLQQLALLPDKPWAANMMSHWQAGEAAAKKKLGRFLASAVRQYDTQRDLPAIGGTSGLSPHLHFGEISPRQVLHKLFANRTSVHSLGGAEQVFAKEMLWREFACSLLHYFPQTINEPLDKRFERFPWAKNQRRTLQAWQQGRTGVPMVDAGMRELYSTGWMHNRVRMIVASYLVKNLRVPWQRGEQWFRDTLVDADNASNVMGWQWAAGSGADAAPYFRVFNPVLQGEKFDRQGDYVRKWVPELATLDTRYIHKPWELPDEQRKHLDYPPPLVDLKQSRQRALAAFDVIKTPA